MREGLGTARTAYGVLAVVVGVLSLVSLIESLTSVGFTTVFRDLVGYYRLIARGLFSLPFALVPWEPPQTLIDFWTLSFLGAGGYVLTPGIEKSRMFRERGYERLPLGSRLGLLFGFGVTGFGLVFLFGAVNPLTYADGFHEEPLDLMRGATAMILWILLGAIVFFAMNTLAPSV